jgi:hypothetical protein
MRDRVLDPHGSGALRSRGVIALALCLSACGSKKSLTKAEAEDPLTCKQCHPRHYDEWSRSMHAYASEDPVFIAMNKRGQRASPPIADFCIKCHAPVALLEGATMDGTNLASVPQKLHGVTCYFCHTADSVTGTHNASLHLAGDVLMRGGIHDPVDNNVHDGAYSPIHDNVNPMSATLCGSCHDIVTHKGAALERTFAEWQTSVFATGSMGKETCAGCHMNPRQGLAAENVPGVKLRTVHSHVMAAVDTALTPFTESDTLKMEVASELQATVQAELCVETNPTNRIIVILDNIGAGHRWPSGASQDRRLWVEVVAKKGGQTIYQSGVVTSTMTPESADADTWLVRDCIYDETGKEVHMFWEAASVKPNQLPAPLTINRSDPRFFATHVSRRYPYTTDLPEIPDEVTLRVRLQPIGLSVLDDLIAGGDLDSTLRAQMPTLDLPIGDELGQTTLKWTIRTASVAVSDQQEQLRCVGPGVCQTNGMCTVITSSAAKSHLTCG